MPRQVGSNPPKFPLEELIAQCDLAVKTIDETVISVGRTLEESLTDQITSVIQSPLTVLERNIEKLRGVQNTVEEIMRIKDKPFCGTRYTTRQVTDWTFRGVDYFAAIVAVALIIMETSDTASKYLGDTDVPKGFTAALVMVSKILSAATDYRNKKKLEHEKFLGMLKDVRLKCEKIEEAAAIYNVFRSISNLKSEIEAEPDSRLHCKQAVKVLKSMPQTKMQGDLAKNLKRQLSTAIETQARELVEARFRAIFDKNNPINIKRRLFERWVDHMSRANKMAKINKYNRFMILENKDKLKFTFKQWASILFNRKKILEKSRELLHKSSYGASRSGGSFPAFPGERSVDAVSSSSFLVATSLKREPASLDPKASLLESEDSVGSQDIDSDEVASMHSSVDDRFSTRWGPSSVSSSQSRQTHHKSFSRRLSGSQPGDFFDRDHLDSRLESGRVSLRNSGEMNPSATALPPPGYNLRLFSNANFMQPHQLPVGQLEFEEGQSTDPRWNLQAYGGDLSFSGHSEGFGVIPPDHSLLHISAPRSVKQRSNTATVLYNTQGTAFSDTGSRKSSVSLEREQALPLVPVENMAKSDLPDQTITIQSSLCFANEAQKQGEVLSQNIPRDTIRLNLPPLPMESNSKDGAACDHVVVQLGND